MGYYFKNLNNIKVYAIKTIQLKSFFKKLSIAYIKIDELETTCGFDYRPIAFVSDWSQLLTQQSNCREAGGKGKNVWIWFEF